MASSSVILTGPLAAWPNAGDAVRMQQTTAQAVRPAQIFQKSRVGRLDFKVCLRFRQRVAVSSYPHVHGRQQENAHQQSAQETSYNDNCEGTLRVGPDRV